MDTLFSSSWDAVYVNRETYLFRVHHLGYFLISRMCICCGICRTDISVLEVPATEWKSCPYVVWSRGGDTHASAGKYWLLKEPSGSFPRRTSGGGGCVPGIVLWELADQGQSCEVKAYLVDLRLKNTWVWDWMAVNPVFFLMLLLVVELDPVAS